MAIKYLKSKITSESGWLTGEHSFRVRIEYLNPNGDECEFDRNVFGCEDAGEALNYASSLLLQATFELWENYEDVELEIARLSPDPDEERSWGPSREHEDEDLRTVEDGDIAEELMDLEWQVGHDTTVGEFAESVAERLGVSRERVLEVIRKDDPSIPEGKRMCEVIDPNYAEE